MLWGNADTDMYMGNGMDAHVHTYVCSGSRAYVQCGDVMGMVWAARGVAHGVHVSHVLRGAGREVFAVGAACEPQGLQSLPSP